MDPVKLTFETQTVYHLTGPNGWDGGIWTLEEEWNGLLALRMEGRPDLGRLIVRIVSKEENEGRMVVVKGPPSFLADCLAEKKPKPRSPM